MEGPGEDLGTAAVAAFEVDPPRAHAPLVHVTAIVLLRVEQVEIPGEAGGLERVGRLLALVGRTRSAVVHEGGDQQREEKGAEDQPAGRGDQVGKQAFHRRISQRGPPSFDSPRPPNR